MRAAPARHALLLLLCVGSLAGCLVEPQDCGDPPTVATPVVDGPYMQTDPRQAWQTVVLAPAETEPSWSASAGWQASGRPVGSDASFQAVNVSPKEGAAGNATLGYTVRTQGACEHAGSVAWDLASPKPGDAAVPGQGVHVMTAGFFENGTLFYTNIAEIDADPRWPRVSWYSWEGDAPLPVYVYDADRSEMPAHWHAASDNVPTTGTPADPPVQEAASGADARLGTGYFTTIPGFNDALKGLSSTTTRVVRLAPEEAYTRPGYEEHDLYGYPIVFYIKVLDVVAQPCPAVTPPMLCQVGVPR